MRDIIIPIGGTRPPEPNNQCSLCKRTVPPSQLTRCPRCKQLFCKSCITEDLREGEYLICLNCARRYVSPKASAFKGKYTPLTLYLSRKAKWTRWIKLQFSQIEGLIGKDLPASAHQNPEWWKNKNSVHAKAWQSIGWNIKEVNLKEKTVIFTRPEVLTPEKQHKPKRTSPLSQASRIQTKKEEDSILDPHSHSTSQTQKHLPQKSLNQKIPRKISPKISVRKTPLENRRKTLNVPNTTKSLNSARYVLF